MRKGGGKSKGSAFERLVCRELSLWVSRGKQKDVFWRSAMSGGRATVEMKKGGKLSAQAGDVSSIHRLGHRFIDLFLVECKAYAKLNYDSLLKGNGLLVQFWDIALEEARSHGKEPLLVAKQNNFPVIVCTTEKGVRLLQMDEVLRAHLHQHGMYILFWEDFLQLNPKKMPKKSKVTKRKKRVRL